MKNVEIPKWLERLPFAPEFHPTDTEFTDPIAYISKIEKEASSFGICKIVPPLPKPSRKHVLHNLNKTLAKCPEFGSEINLVTSSRSSNDLENRAMFTTRHQELGCDKGKKMKGMVGDQIIGAKKQVWQSGEVYSLEQFEAKSKNFSRSELGTLKEVNPLVIESMFWKASTEKPIYIEYANDVPGSAFSEPEGLLNYFRKRRRRRKRNSFDRNNNSSSFGTKYDNVDTSISSKRDDNLPSYSLPSPQSQKGASSERKDSNSIDDMEGSSGWELSNSRWNLQVIARSPGSLTRFMPDDIPGVTSPMVYIGMLFSWFAWHVEDHELHSLNYLHMGSPKTWYAVPGDYATNFEEIIRLHAYGGNIDPLVALSLLGEKTTVLSPEVFVASGIPCCRLVQNPGEFVVTFPRAYHVGFSHGFNCGEAANFGTPNWLTVAKEAAVRRAAMNFLPMLSHQQLLYLLTMSFISRIPRSLLPGVRSSRSRDRQKESREFLVKKAFMKDILRENNLLTVLLQRNSYHSVFWDLESLPSSRKESELCKKMDAASLTSKEKESNDDRVDQISMLNKYIGAVGFDLNDDDLAYDFQMDSGTLPCVACGVLGFPFMAIVQPSKVTLRNLMLENTPTAVVESPFRADLNHVAEGSQDATATNKAKSNKTHFCHLNSAFKEWDTSNIFLKPRIFCLDHATQLERLLSSKGGANVLVICHSDFQKIKAHAAVIAEEISSPFDYNEIPLINASHEDLNLIDIAIGNEEQVDFEDWTSQLSINLRHCIKTKTNSPSKNVQYLLTLSGLSCDKNPVPDSNASSSVQWLSRKLRSKPSLKHHLSQSKSSLGMESSEEDDSKPKLEHEIAKKDTEIIQYSRKKYKSHTSAVRDTNTAFEDRINEDKITGLVVSVNNLSESLIASSTMTANLEKQIGIEENEACSENHSSPSLVNESTPDSIQEQDDQKMITKTGRKRKRDKSNTDASLQTEEKIHFQAGFVKSPCEGLRPRARKDVKVASEETPSMEILKNSLNKKEHQRGLFFKCDIDGCKMSFKTKAELVMHKGNQCSIKGCKRKFSSHKYTLLHQRVHDDYRPLKCTWSGCKMSFKWAWARTEHLRVHTGERPYVCKVKGCGLTFRFVSDISRHRRKTKHYVT